MSILTLVGTLVVGLVLLILGFLLKNRWLKILSVVPFGIVLYQLIRLMGFLLN